MEPAIVISIIIAGGILGGFFMSYQQVRSLKKQQYDETLRKSMSDLYEVYRTDFEVKTKAECELFATRILDILAVLAHLNNEKKLPDTILEFVKFDLEIAKGIMKWFDKEGLGKKYNPSSSAKIWSNLTEYFKKHKTKTCKEDALPDCIKNYKDLK